MTTNPCQVSNATTHSAVCKYCGSKNAVKYGKRRRVQYYLCRDCGHTFAGNNALPGMRFPPEQIAASINMFYDGLSIDAIRRQLESLYKACPSDSTVHTWIVRFTKAAAKEVKISNVKVGDLWIVGETVLNTNEDKDVWLWDIMDDKTRFLLASLMLSSRTMQNANKLMSRAVKAAGHPPKILNLDKRKAHLDGIEIVFGDDTSHPQQEGFMVEPNMNMIERFHGTLEARIKVIRRMKKNETAKLIMEGWLVHYNFFRPQEALNNKTPGELAKATFPYKSWQELIIGSNSQNAIRVST
jgi:putative transposase